MNATQADELLAKDTVQTQADKIEGMYRKLHSDLDWSECSIYTVSTKTHHGYFVVEAPTYQHAANIALFVLHGLEGRGIARTKLVARRTTGAYYLSGWFQGYRTGPSGVLNSTGPSFHVM